MKYEIKSIIIGLGINFVSSPQNLDYKTICINSFSKKENPLNFFVHLTKEISESILNIKKIVNKTDQKFLRNFKDFGKKINIKRNGKLIYGVFSGIGRNGEIIIKKNDKLSLINYGEIFWLN